MKKKFITSKIRLIDWEPCSNEEAEAIMEEHVLGMIAKKEKKSCLSHLRLTGGAKTALFISLTALPTHKLVDLQNKVLQNKISYEGEPQNYLLYGTKDGKKWFIKSYSDYGEITVLN